MSAITPKERLLRVLRKEPVDRPPVICTGGMMNAAIVEIMRATGHTLPEAHFDARRMADLAQDVQAATEFENIGNKYGERFTEHEMWRTLDTIVMDEIATQGILKEMQKGAVSAREVSERLDIAPPDALKYVLALQRRGLVGLAGIDGATPKYKILVRAEAAA